MNKEIVVCGIPFGKPEEKEALKYVKDNGFTSVQIYVFWRDLEPCARGCFNWEQLDRQVESIRSGGLKFVPFILMGPKYAAPDWWLKDGAHNGMTCLEHGIETPIESVWNMRFRQEIDRALKAFAGHYLSWDVLESIQPGICGDYGEAIFPVTGNWPGDYHTHRGFWCGGDDAAESFRSAMKNKYGTIGKLNEKWRAHYLKFAEIKPFLRVRMPSRTAYLDMLGWYNDSMTKYAEFWMHKCREYFDRLPVYLCTGGMEEPEHGSSFPDQAKIAARHHGGIRLTNEGNNFYDNFYLTVHMQSASRFYGAYAGLEPVGPILPQGVAVRTYGSAAYGNRQIFHYFGNLFSNGKPNGAAKIAGTFQNIAASTEERARIAFFWPISEASVNGVPIPGNVKSAITFIRKHYQIDAVSEKMVMDGVLDNYNLLIVMETGITEQCVLEKIAAWVENGGTVLSDKRTLNIEEERVPAYDAIFGITGDSEEVWGHSEYFPCECEWTKKLGTIQKVHSMTAWNKLSDKVRPLLKNKPGTNAGKAVTTREAFCAFENDHGRGRGIFYSGPVDLDAQTDAIWTPSDAFPFLLEDCCGRFSGAVPLELKDDEIARTRTDCGMLVLMKNHSIRELRRKT